MKTNDPWQLIKKKAAFPQNWTSEELLDLRSQVVGGMWDNNSQGGQLQKISSLTLIESINTELRDRSVKKQSNLTLAISLAATLISLIAIYLAIKSDYQSQEWKSDEILLLQEIRNELQSLSP